jgi:hypothetical protein
MWLMAVRNLRPQVCLSGDFLGGHCVEGVGYWEPLVVAENLENRMGWL